MPLEDHGTERSTDKLTESTLISKSYTIIVEQLLITITKISQQLHNMNFKIDNVEVRLLWGYELIIFLLIINPNYSTTMFFTQNTEKQ